jgi:TatD DNase family protein
MRDNSRKARFDASVRPGVVWTDAHCHLDDDGMPAGAEAALAAARAAGVARIVTIGTDAGHSAAAIELAAAHADVWATVGLHPHDAVQGVESILDLLECPRVVGVGECGLDYHYDHSPRDVQRVHTREAWDETFAILATEGVPTTTIFHCFTGGPAEAERALALGAHLSFSGIVSFKTAADVREAAALCPIERLLVETDAPYLAPVPHRGRPNQPAFLPAVGTALAEATGRTVAEIASATHRNAGVAFRLPAT